jgi:twitching motility protein PilT
MAELPFAFSPSSSLSSPQAPLLGTAEQGSGPEPPDQGLSSGVIGDWLRAQPAAAAGPTLEALVQIAYDNKYSDIHLGVGEAPRFRHNGDIITTDLPVTDPDEFQGWLREVLDPGQLDSFRQNKEYDGSFAFSFVRTRINLLQSVHGPALVMRLIPVEISNFESLGLPEVFKTMAARPKGMLLVTGATGSGKTTTLAAIIDHINSTMKRHILTIEDPVEYVHQSKQSLVRQREVGTHTTTFHQALRAALREDPDVILIGEIRDQETLTAAIKASQTGHLVLGTLHTSSAVRTVERVLGMYPPQDQESMRRAISETLLAVFSQGLIKTEDGGRAAFHDIFINTDACRDYIMRAELDEIEQIMSRSSSDGMQTANQALARLVQEGRASAEEALSHSLRPSELDQILRGRT